MSRIALTFALVPLVLLTACEFGANRMSSWEKDRLEARASEDIDDFLAQFDEFGSGMAEANEARDDHSYHWESCIAGYAGCLRCYTLDGIPGEGGTLSMEHVLGDEVEECRASVTLNDVMFAYTIHEWWWDGQWAPRADGLFDVAWNGAASSTLLIEGSENNDGEYTYDYKMNEATAVTDGEGDISEWSVDYEYDGFLDRQFQVKVSKDADGVISGTISGDATCTVSGQDYDYVIDCV